MSRGALRRQRCRACNRLSDVLDTFTSPRTGQLIRNVCPECTETHQLGTERPLQTERLPLQWHNP